MSSPLFETVRKCLNRYASHYIPQPIKKLSNSAFVYIVTHHRWVLVVFFLIPLSVVYDILWFVYNKISSWKHTVNPKLHDERVQRIKDQVLSTPPGMKMCTARPSYLTMNLNDGKYKHSMKQIDVSLYDVLAIDEEKGTVTVEPGCTMGQITKEICSKGWTLAVTPELDDLTVGGLIMGFGIESSSHKYGLFQHICVSFEIVLPDGQVILCDKDNHPSLFYNIPWSHGTLGFLTAAEIKIVQCTSLVQLTYYPFHSKQDYIDAFTRFSKDSDFEFVEGLVYSPEQAVIMTGTYAPNVPHGCVYNPIGRWYKTWFYQHAQSFLHKNPRITNSANKDGTFTEFIPLRDYFHRHSRSVFWELKDIVPFGDHWLARLLLGYFLPPRISLMKLTTTEALQELYEKHHVVQDMLVPISTLGDSMTVFDTETGVYPVWLCPMMVYKTPVRGLVNPTPSGETLFVDVGVYGNPTVSNFNAKETMRKVESFVRKVSGFQALYADNYLTREEFRKMFDHSEYDKLRKEYNADELLPEIYDKVSHKARH